MSEFVQIKMSVRTRESMRNLFAILDITGDSFDDQLFELATLAFSAASRPIAPLLSRSPEGKQPRRHVDMKGRTYYDLRDMHNKLFPFLPWQSWDWLLNELMKMATEERHHRGFSMVGE